MKLNKRLVEAWISNGIYFGYPTCCIAEFITEVNSGAYKKRNRRKFNGTGYVPCKACNRQPKAVILMEIEQSRICKTPFPEDGF